MKIRTSRRAGFTLVEIMIVVAIIGLLAAIAIPNFVQARNDAQIKACVNNLRQIDGAIQQAALELKITDGGAVTLDNVKPYLRNNVIPACPGGGTYAVTTIDAAPTCSGTSGGKSHQTAYTDTIAGQP